MNQRPSDPYLGALREDWPSAADQARIRRRLIGTGIGLSLALVPKTVAASSLLKTGLIASLSSRFMNLSLISQFSVVTAATTVAITVPVWISEQASDSKNLETHGRRVGVIASMRPPAPARPAERGGMPVQSALPQIAENGENQANAAKVVSHAQPGAPKPARENASLDGETRLLDAALSAIRTGELGRAAALLDEHATRFENGKLGRERQRARAKLEQARRLAAHE